LSQLPGERRQEQDDYVWMHARYDFACNLNTFYSKHPKLRLLNTGSYFLTFQSKYTPFPGLGTDIKSPDSASRNSLENSGGGGAQGTTTWVGYTPLNERALEEAYQAGSDLVVVQFSGFAWGDARVSLTEMVQWDASGRRVKVASNPKP